MPRLVLFDIDLTLIHAHGAGRHSFEAAFAETFDVPLSESQVGLYHGNTDPVIFRTMAAGLGRTFTAEHETRCFEFYFKNLEEKLKTMTEPRILPGVLEILEFLQGQSQVTLGLQTGNMERGAQIKLKHFGLEKHFALGAFASDSIDRNRFVPIAINKAQRLLGRVFSPQEVVVIGDTVKDIACGRAGNAVSIGVATGVHTAQQLQEAGADYVLNSLADYLQLPSSLWG